MDIRRSRNTSYVPTNTSKQSVMPHVASATAIECRIGFSSAVRAVVFGDERPFSDPVSSAYSQRTYRSITDGQVDAISGHRLVG